MRRTRTRLKTLERLLRQAMDRLAQVEDLAKGNAPASEVERLNRAFEMIADRAPASEVERLNYAFELISEALEQISQRAPVSEVERLNLAFDRITQLASGETLRLNRAFANFRPSERVVEVPWVFSKYQGEERALEIGYAWAEEFYLDGLGRLRIPFLVGIDAADSPRDEDVLAPFHRVKGDVLVDCFRSESFDLIFCVSTIEHIGRDNLGYGLDTGRDIANPDHVAIENMANWLAPGGRLLLTVPFGRYEDHGWLINYDMHHLGQLLKASKLTIEESLFYGWLPGGWHQVQPELLADHGYQTLGASHAAGVALVELSKKPRKS